MRFILRFLNIEFGFFVKKRFVISDLFRKFEYNKPSAFLSNDEKKKWKLDYDIEKRILAITGYNFDKKSLDESGTCLLKWLFRDVQQNVLYNPKYFDAVLDVPLENTENWRETLIKNGATGEQIRVFNVCCGYKLRNVMEKIASENFDLFISVREHYDEDSEFNILISSIR